MRAANRFFMFAAAPLTITACQRDDLTSPSRPDATAEMPVEASASGPMTVGTAGVVATVDLRHGGTLTFVDLGDGHIGMAERAPREAPFVSVPLIERLNATPLEAYLALRPQDAATPDALVRDHRMRSVSSGGQAREPRILAAPGSRTKPLADPGYGAYECGPEMGGVTWEEDWKAAFAGITKYRSADYRHNLTNAMYTFYPGAPAYYGTNTNSKTYLGACNGSEEHTLDMQVQRRVHGAADADGEGWVEVSYASLEHEKFTFYSGLPGVYRARVWSWGACCTIDAYGIGAAWTPSPPLTGP